MNPSNSGPMVTLGDQFPDGTGYVKSHRSNIHVQEQHTCMYMVMCIGFCACFLFFVDYSYMLHEPTFHMTNTISSVYGLTTTPR